MKLEIKQMLTTSFFL